MRWTVLLILALGCPAPIPPVVGAKCSDENIGRCDAEARQLLQCTSATWRIYADCHGANGCKVAADTAVCDTSGNSVGDRCALTSEGKVRCDPDGGLRILRCVDGGLEVIFECRPPDICGINDAGMLTCI